MQGSVLVLDSGNALFRVPASVEARGQERADLILRAMGEFGTFAMAAGARDLNAGADALKRGAEKAHVAVLSANLAASGKPVFPPSAIATVHGTRVGVIGVVAPSNGANGYTAGLAVPAALAEARALKGKVDVTIVLAAVTYADALQVALEGKGLVDFVIQSHESRGAGAAQRVGTAVLVPGGDRGRQVGRLELALSGKGPWVDAAEAERERQLVTLLDRQIAELQARIGAAKDEAAKKALQASVDTFEKNRAEHKKNAAADSAGGRTFQLSWLALSPDVASDSALKAAVDRLEPPPSR